MSNDIFNVFPKIHTERLVLREIKPEDAESLFKLYSSGEVAKYETFTPYTDIKQVEKLMEWFNEDYKNGRAIVWGISLKGENEIIGILRCEIEVPEVRADFGYDLRHEYWNKGIITETITALLPFTFDKIDVNRIEAAVSTKNIGSIRVLEKTGFKKEGILRQRSRLGGSLHDMIMFSILRDEYREKRM